MGVGTILGYSSPAGVILMKYNGNNDTESDLYLTKAQNSWVSSVANLGALIGCPFAGFCIDFLGRRGTILYSVFPVTIGWAYGEKLHNDLGWKINHWFIL
ncbi:hypothetical protein Avbf_18355 [Armadillidium vulgare]|nr:hypothetical protein Avbf_18355 [Armadillidium vulgare]